MWVRVREATLTAAELEATRRPREAVVLERQIGPDEFDATEGPVSAYRRILEVSPADAQGRYFVRQRLEFQPAIPYWGWLFGRPMFIELARIKAPDRAPFWFPPERLDRHASGVLARLGVLALVLGYAGTLMTQTITYAADEFGQGRTAQGFALAAMRADVLLAVPLAMLADRRGRRYLAVLGTSAACALSSLSALSPNLFALTTTQTLARGFNSAAAVALGIMVAEEVPKGARAWSTSIIVVAGAFGAGSCVFLLPVADLTDWTWRLLYLVPLLAIPLARSAARGLAESRRFVTSAAKSRSVLRGHARRFWLLAVSAFLLALFATPASQFQNEFLKTDRGFSGAQITMFVLLTSIPGAISIAVGGRLAEQSRRMVGAVAVVGGVGATVLMFNAAGWPLWTWSCIGSLIGPAAVPALGVYGPELFPTGARGAANGVLGLVGRIGSVVGLLTVGYLADRVGIGRALTYVAIGPLLLAILIIAAYPETAHLELEEINPEDASPSPAGA